MAKKFKRSAIRHDVRLAVTGHRKWSHPNREMKNLFSALDRLIETLDKVNIESDRLVFLHGCAMGVDLWFGHYAMTHEIPFEMYLPFKVETQLERGKFGSVHKRELLKQLDAARNVVIVNRKFHTYGYEKRNRVMIDSAQILLTYFTRSRSGSGNAWRYAVKLGRSIVDLRSFYEKADLPESIHDVNLLME